MAGYQGCISLALACLSLVCHETTPYKSTACTSHTNLKRHKDFLKRHVGNEKAPETNDQPMKWYNYLKARNMIRPTQSFMKRSEKDKVNAVCSSEGGWQYTNQNPAQSTNLCISKDTFKFVRLSVTEEEKNLILACDLVGNNNLCRPVHFERNPTNDNYDHKEDVRGCQDGPAK